MKLKLVGDKCKKCGTPTIKAQSKRKFPKPNQTFYYKYFLRCPNCRTPYYLPEQIVFLKQQPYEPRAGTVLNRGFRKEIMEIYRGFPEEKRSTYGKIIVNFAKTMV